jgi:hypothetical protein
MGYLDVYSREYSVHNVLPFRNLTVKHDSGESGTIRLEDHLGNRRGLNPLLTQHCGKFGLDSEYGTRKVSEFSGYSTYIDIGSSATWNNLIGPAGTSQVSISAWINTREWTTTGNILDFSNGGIQFGVTNNGPFVRTLFLNTDFSTTDGIWHISTDPFSLNSWVHVCLTYDSSNVSNDPKFYINGSSVSVTEHTTPVGTMENFDAVRESKVGASATGTPANFFNGQMAEVAIWNRILTPTEVTEVYNAGIINGLTDVLDSTKINLQLWYRMGEGFDTRAKFYDESGNDKHSNSVNQIDFSNYIDDTKPSYHKTFKNTTYRITEGSALSSPSLEKTHNNAFIGTPIPASDYQYSWIDNALRSEHGIDSGQQNHYKYSPANGILSSSAGYVEAIIFPSSSNIT